MRVNVQCPSCGKAYNVEDNLLGKTTRCRQCGESFKLISTEVREVAASPTPAAPAPAAPAQAASAAIAAPKVAAGPIEKLARFEIRAKLGAGAFGTVYRAFDPQLEREIALKVPQPGVLDSPKRIERFLREAKSAAQLQHPNIVPIFDAGKTPPSPPSQGGDPRSPSSPPFEGGNAGGVYYIASAFVQGHPLADVIDEKGINPRRAAKIVQRLAEALAYAHQLGIVHRDIKPANIMLDDDDQPHLMDFGLAARTDSTEKLTQDGAVLGTPAYMAPEHAAGHQGESFPASDQYSLGVVLYELLTGKTPWEGPPQIVLYNVLHKEPPAPRSLRKDIPRDLETICLKAMAKQSEHRYRDCQAMADDLRRWLEGEPVKARRPGFGERIGRWVKREPKLAAAGLLFLIGAVTLAIALGILAQKLAGEYAEEQTAHGKTKKSLTDEQAEHTATKGDRYVKQVGLAKEQIEAHNLTGGMQSLVSCPTELRGWEWAHLRQLAQGSPDAFHVLQGKGKIHHIVFSGDSKELFTQHAQGNRTVWDLTTLKFVCEPQTLKLEEWTQARFTSDGKIIAELVFQPVQVPRGPDKEVKSPPAKIVIKEIATERLVKEFAIPGGMNVFTLSADGTKVAVANSPKFKEPHTITIYDAQTGQELHKLEGEIPSVTELVFSPDASALAVLYGGGVGTVKKIVPVQKEKTVDGKTVTETTYQEVMETVMLGGNKVKVVETSSGKEMINSARDTMGMTRAIFAPDGKRFCFLHPEGVDVYSLGDNKELFTLAGRVGALAFSPDGKRIATASGQDNCPPDGLVKLWDAATGRFIVGLATKGYTNAYDKLLFSPDGAWLAAVPVHSTQIFLFSTSGGSLLTPYEEHGCPVASVTWSPDGKLLSSWADCNHSAHVWDAGTGQRQLLAPNQIAAGLGFSTDGKYLATGGGCLGAVPHQGYGYGRHSGGYGCYGGFGGVNVFATSGFKAAPPPKGYDAILAASKNGKHWLLKPTIQSDGKPITAESAPKLQLWSVADEKESLALGELDFTSQALFTDDGSRIIGIGHGPAETTGYKPVWTKRKQTKTVQKEKDGKKYNEQVEFEVNVCQLVPYKVTVFAPNLKLLDTATGKKIWQSYGVNDLFAVSADGKLVATLPPPIPKQAPMKMPEEKDVLPAPKEELKKLPAPKKTARVARQEQGFVAFQEEKKAPTSPLPPPVITPGTSQPDIAMPPPIVPAPPITLWVVDEEQDGGTKHFSLAMPGQTTMMRFSPDGKYLAAYTPEGWKEVTYATTRNVIEGGKTKPILEEHIRKERAPVLIVFETATGRQVLTHVGASGLAVFCNGSGHLASAAGLPKFLGPNMGQPVVPGPAMANGHYAHRSAEPPLLGEVSAAPFQVAALGQAPLPAPVPTPTPAIEGENEPRPVDGPAPAMIPFADTALVVFDLATGKETHRFHGHSSQITALAFSPDCKLLASGSYGTPNSCMEPPGLHFAQIIFWDLSAKKRFQVITGHTGSINCMGIRSGRQASRQRQR